MIYGFAVLAISFSLSFWLKKLKMLYVFENKRFYYTITFILDVIGFSLIFEGLSIVIPLLLLLIMYIFDKYISNSTIL